MGSYVMISYAVFCLKKYSLTCTRLQFPMATRLLYIAGDQSGVGKSSVSLSILNYLLKVQCCTSFKLRIRWHVAAQNGYSPQDLGYIKPATQCEDVQLVAKFIEGAGIEHNGVGPIK